MNNEVLNVIKQITDNNPGVRQALKSRIDRFLHSYDNIDDSQYLPENDETLEVFVTDLVLTTFFDGNTNL